MRNRYEGPVLLMIHGRAIIRTEIIAVACFLLSIVMFACKKGSVEAPQTQQVQSEPRLVTVNLGEVELATGESRDLSHVFTVCNDDNSNKIVETVRTSCGCVEATISKRDIEPSGCVEMKMKIRATASGALAHSAMVRFTDGDIVQFEMKAYIHRPIDVRVIAGGDVAIESGEPGWEVRVMVSQHVDTYSVPHVAVDSKGRFRVREVRWWEVERFVEGNRPRRLLGQIVVERNDDECKRLIESLPILVDGVQHVVQLGPFECTEG